MVAGHLLETRMIFGFGFKIRGSVLQGFSDGGNMCSDTRVLVLGKMIVMVLLCE